ncbi:MAG TPA: hypothetical protein PKW79_02310 [Rhabdochlamydiaceae bacterium]|nr:hypothetical protein [Rhabdochlamydiaceae bacterium]
MAKKKRARITVLEAVDNLSHLADLEVGQTEWQDPAKVQENQDTIRETFVTLTQYLQHLYQKEKEELSNPQTQKGLQAMMQLAGEAVDKVGRYTKLFKGAHARDEAIAEFKQLQHFYMSKVFSRVKKEKPEESWEKEGNILQEERQALKDLETVQLDTEYELFYISREDGTPFFTPNLLRHIRMVGNFDESLLHKDQEDIIKRMEVLLDRDLHVSAQEILQEGSNLLDAFCKEALHYKDHEGPASLTKAMMSLMLAANPKNLLHNTADKSCIDYFIDFEVYLRKVLESDDYRKWKSATADQPFRVVCLKLSHFFCNAFFLRSGARHGVISFIRDLVEKRAHELPSIWGTLASIENSIRLELRNYPNGPLMKILRVFRHEEEKSGFDPVLQYNPPSSIFTLSSESAHTSVIHLPCPVHQDFIDRVNIVPEFKGYLRSLGTQKHLYINLQDRTSWKEHKRAVAIEELSKTGEFVDVLQVITLAKSTDFYFQMNDYAELNHADEFCKRCVEQITEGSQYGFYLPESLMKRSQIEPLVNFVHEQFFEAKKTLARKERLDFIEIFYFFVTLKLLDQEKPDVISFSCKDGVDTGAAMVAAFYGFSRMLSTSKPWTEEDKEFFIYAFFGPSFLVRNRSISPPIFQRSLSALDWFDNVIQGRRDKILKACADLFPELPFTQIKVA